jgi:NAD(P)-dependent dehydrogenase (short-subunit alcohol dehydrogenase family)
LTRELTGKVAIVTGGGRGLGREVCRSLGLAGADVVVADLRSESAEAAARELAQERVRAVPVGLDVGDESQAGDVVGTILSRFGRIDILVNNAGTDVTLPIEELSFADWDRVLRTNLHGPFVMSKRVWPVMRQNGGGHIVNVVSTAAKRAWPNASAYHASKWGLLGLSHALHAEGRPHGIKVTAVVAGGMRTPFLLDRFPDLDPNVLQDPANVAATIRFVLNQPEETVIPEIMVLPMRETSWP